MTTRDLSTELITLSVENGIATIELNRPKVNAINVEMQRGLREAAEICTLDSEVRAVVLRGSQRSFAAGVDIKEMAAMSHADMVAHVHVMHDAYNALAAIPKPVVAAVTGYALGGGMELAMTADIRIVAEDVTFGQPEVKLGIMAGAGGSQRLPRLVGPSRAKDILFTGRNIDAEEAYRIGLADKVVPADQVFDAAHEWAAQFVDGPALALRGTKQAVDAGLGVDIASGLAMEKTNFAMLFATEDRTIGMQSFIENGPSVRAPFIGK